MEPNEARVYRGEEPVIVPPIEVIPTGPYGGLWTFRCPACNRMYDLPQGIWDIELAHKNGKLHYFRPCGCITPRIIDSSPVYVNSDGMTYTLTVNDSMGTIHGVNVDLDSWLHICEIGPDMEGLDWWNGLSEKDRRYFQHLRFDWDNRAHKFTTKEQAYLDTYDVVVTNNVVEGLRSPYIGR